MNTFFNELSLPALHSEIEVIALFQQLGNCYKSLRNYGVTDIVIGQNFYEHQFTTQYYYYNWIKDKRPDEDLKTLLKSVIGSVFPVENILIQYEKENNKALEMSVNGTACIGLGLASELIFDTISISYNNGNWTNANYDISILNVEEDENGELKEIEDISVVKNISTLDHVETHQEFLMDETKESIQNGRDLWIRRTNIFPNLIFGIEVEKQISHFADSDLGFQQIIKRLFELQNVASEFNGNPIEPEIFPTKTTPESDGREKKLKTKLHFKDANNNVKSFTWHCRFTPSAGRIYFIAYENDKKILIGYIGNKIL